MALERHGGQVQNIAGFDHLNEEAQKYIQTEVLVMQRAVATGRSHLFPSVCECAHLFNHAGRWATQKSATFTFEGVKPAFVTANKRNGENLMVRAVI